MQHKSKQLKNNNPLHMFSFSNKYRHSRFLSSVCAGGGLGRGLLAAISPHDVGSSCAQRHQRRAGKSERLHERNKHRNKSGQLNIEKLDQVSFSELLNLSIKIIYMYFKAFLLNLWNILNISACDLLFTCTSAEI